MPRPPLGKTPYRVTREVDPKHVPVTRTIEDAIDHYRVRNHHDPDHVLLNPTQIAGVGDSYTHSRDGLTVDVYPEPIVPVNEVYAGHSATGREQP